jgi:hypothetical protein
MPGSRRCFEEKLDALGEVVNCRIDQGDNQHFLIISQVSLLHQLRVQHGKGVRFTAAGHSRDPIFSAAKRSTSACLGRGLSMIHLGRRAVAQQALQGG